MIGVPFSLLFLFPTISFLMTISIISASKCFSTILTSVGHVELLKTEFMYVLLSCFYRVTPKCVTPECVVRRRRRRNEEEEEDEEMRKPKCVTPKCVTPECVVRRRRRNEEEEEEEE